MIYGYIRVSTKEQDVTKQKFAIFYYAHCRRLKTDEIVEETISSVKFYKNRLLCQLIEKVKKDDFESRAQQLRNEFTTQAELRLVITRLEEFAEKVKDGLSDANWLTKRELIRTLVKRFEVGKEGGLPS